MKTPDALRAALRRQWQNGNTRRQRLLDDNQWPLSLAIGKPAPTSMSSDVAAVRAHIEQWRRVAVGEVRWQAVNYRSLSEPIDLPINWVLSSPRQWVEAMSDTGIAREYRLMSSVLDAVDPVFHPLLVGQRQLLLSRGAEESRQACVVAQQLRPGCADGRPLRALSVAGCDSKFLERNRALLTRLLAVRFGEAVTDQGLEGFLGAADEGEHWLLVAPLDGQLLPFKQLRLRSSELRQSALPGSHVLIVENERSLYQLPGLDGTVAILGAGLNLGWMYADWLGDRVVGYWGDIDTWGLCMLAAARSAQPGLSGLMMDVATFLPLADRHAVVEPVRADSSPPAGLNEHERAVYSLLQGRRKGRLEQEFVPLAQVHLELNRWRLRRQQ